MVSLVSEKKKGSFTNIVHDLLSATKLVETICLQRPLSRLLLLTLSTLKRREQGFFGANFHSTCRKQQLSQLWVGPKYLDNFVAWYESLVL